MPSNTVINRGIKKLNDECDLGFSFDDKFKPDNHILFFESRANGKIG